MNNRPLMKLRTPHSAALRTSAFTLVEMLLVLVILATLAAIVIPKMAGRSQQAKVTAAQTQISAFKTALESYEVDTGAFPKNGNLGELVSSSVQGWRGPYLDRIPTDPWGGNYEYDYPGKHGTFDLISPGPDGRTGTDDDINNWSGK